MWHLYVTNLCTKTWGMSEAATTEVVRRIEALAVDGKPSETALEIVLMEAGIEPRHAVRVAPTIRVAIRA